MKKCVARLQLLQSLDALSEHVDLFLMSPLLINSLRAHTRELLGMSVPLSLRCCLGLLQLARVLAQSFLLHVEIMQALLRGTRHLSRPRQRLLLGVDEYLALARDPLYVTNIELYNNNIKYQYATNRE